MVDGSYNVLFLCTGNSARSQVAECILNRVGQGRFRAYSAGSQPSGEVHPLALDLLRNENHDVDALRSKSWAEFEADGAPQMDIVITVCDNAAAEACPVWPGQPITAHWGLPDPAAATGDDAQRKASFADVYRELSVRLEKMVSLPIEQLDRLSLQERIRALGNQAPGTA